MEEKYSGLTENQAKKNFDFYGPNEIKEVKKFSAFKILIHQIKSNFMVYLLFFSMILSFLVGKDITAFVILFVTIAVVGTGFFQEYKAEKSIEKLKEMIMPVSIVVRSGIKKEISTSELVPDDIIILRTGEKVPADAIVLSEKNLLINESILTGESEEVKKFAVENTNSFSDKNVVFAGSFIVNGKCVAKIIHTGMNTKFGKIATLISKSEKELPLQRKVNTISKYMAMIGISMAILTGFAILIQSEITNELLIEILILAIAVSVSAFPEGFPVVLITTLSVGAHRMSKKNAIVNRMSIIETLGETTVVCTDKTGTITKGEMTVKKVFFDDNLVNVTGTGYSGTGNYLLNEKNIQPSSYKTLNLLLRAAVNCNDASIRRTGNDSEFDVIGAPTEVALLVAGAKANIYSEDFNERIDEVPFSSERKMMSILKKENDHKIIYSKGALEFVLSKCKYVQKNNVIVPLTEKEKQKIYSIKDTFASSAFRTLSFAYKIANSNSLIEKDLVFLGLVAIEDPPREGVKEAVLSCFRAGIKIKLITGDDRATAVSVANQIGLDSQIIVDGAKIDSMSDAEFFNLVKKATIFFRVKPEHKLKIVRMLKQNGEIVTMTGDGVNDAPALKEAHIGVAMGINGTDVSKSVADLTLKDDNFVTLIDAIKEGRTIFNNIRKFVTYQLSCNFSELMIIFIGVLLVPFFGWPFPLLLALQILFMNIVTDNIPAITLGLNKSSKDIMNIAPRKTVNILNKKLMLLLAFAGVLMTFFVLLVFFYFYNVLGQSAENARTTALLVLIILEIAGAFNFRSFRKTTLNRSIFINPYLAIASFISIFATILIIYTPLNLIFETVPLFLFDWVIAFIFGIIFIAVFDVLKFVNNKKFQISFD